MKQFLPDSTGLRPANCGRLGYLEMTLADNFCNGIPLGHTISGVQTFGDPLTTSQVYDSASAHLDSALALTNASDAGTVGIHNFASIIKARLLVDKGNSRLQPVRGGFEETYHAVIQSVGRRREQQRARTLHLRAGCRSCSAAVILPTEGAIASETIPRLVAARSGDTARFGIAQPIPAPLPPARSGVQPWYARRWPTCSTARPGRRRISKRHVRRGSRPQAVGFLGSPASAAEAPVVLCSLTLIAAPFPWLNDISARRAKTFKSSRGGRNNP